MAARSVADRWLQAPQVRRLAQKLALVHKHAHALYKFSTIQVGAGFGRALAAASGRGRGARLQPVVVLRLARHNTATAKVTASCVAQLHTTRSHSAQ